MGAARQRGTSTEAPRSPELEVVLVEPDTAEARADGWRRVVDVLDWLAARGAMDA
jgi:hypothetical protein